MQSALHLKLEINVNLHLRYRSWHSSCLSLVYKRRSSGLHCLLCCTKMPVRKIKLFCLRHQAVQYNLVPTKAGRLAGTPHNAPFKDYFDVTRLDCAM